MIAGSSIAARFARTAAIVIVLGIGAVSAWAHDDPSAQIADLTRQLARASHPAALLLHRGELRRQDGDWRGALTDFDAAAALDPKLPEVDLCRAAVLLDSQDAPAAERAIERFLAARPGRPGALWLRGRARIASGRLPAGVADFDLAMARLPRATPEHYLERARAQVAMGAPAAAVMGLDDGIGRLGPAPALVEMANRLDDSLGSQAAVLTRLERTTESRPRPPAPNISTPQSEQPLVARGSTWKYDATGNDRGTAWRDPVYDDSFWPAGPAPLGFGDPFIVTTVPYGPSASNKYTTTYFRISFPFAGSAAALLAMTLRANYDDGFVAYLNGQEIARRGFPAGAVSYGTLAANHEGGAYETIDVTASKSLLVAGANWLAVEVHQQAPTSSDLAMDLELAATESSTPSLVRGPYLQLGTPNSIVVRWRTDVPAPSRVDFGTDPGLPAGYVSDPTPVTEHETMITGLLPSTRHFYSVSADTLVLAGADSSCSFVTSPPPGTIKATRVWVIGDSGLPGPDANAVRDAYAAYTGPRDTDLWLMLGDNAYQTGTDAEYQAAVFDQYPQMLRHSVLWPTRGNHDILYAGPSNDYYDHFTLPTAGEGGGVPSGNEAYYSFDYGDIHFICLDSEGSPRDSTGAMLQWLESDLAAASADWVIAYWHHPPYTKGSHDSDDPLDSSGRMRDMRQYALPILESWGVDLVLTGHSHSYERSYLLDEHYDVSGTLVDSMKVDAGDGRVGGSGPYQKPSAGLAPHQGAVYAVAGSSAQTSGGALNHPAMVVSLNVLGSLVLDVVGNRLDALFLGADGAQRDSFAIVKGGSVSAGAPGPRTPLRLAAGVPNPFQAATRIPYDLPRAGRVRIDVFDLRGRRVASVVDREEAAGPHEIAWSGRDTRGRSAPAGAYFVLLRFGKESRVSRIVRVE